MVGLIPEGRFSQALRATLARIPGDITAFRAKVSREDLLLFLLFPAIISFVEFLCTLFPVLRDTLALHYSGNHWWQFITWASVHGSFGHYAGNLTSYLCIGAVALVLAAELRDTRLLFVPFGIMALVIPVMDSAFKIFLYPTVFPILFLRLGTASGSSGIVAGLLGLLPFLWLLVLSRESGENLLDRWSFSMVLFYALFALVMAYQPGLNMPTIITVAVLTGLAAVNHRKAGPVLGGMARAATGNIITWLAIASAPVLYLVVPFTLFPRDLVSGNTLIDFIGHLVGLVLGVVIGAAVIWWMRGDGEGDA